MVNVTTDTLNCEQAVPCLRWVDDNISVHKDLIGSYKVETISADSLVALSKMYC